MVIERARRTRFEPEVSLEESELPSSRDLELEDTVTSLLMKLGLQLGEKAGDETEQSISKLNLKNPESIALRVSNVVGSSERVYLTLVSLASILENDTFKHSPALTLAFIMHMIVIGDTRISARSQAQRLEENEENVEIQDFLARFTAISRYILNKNFWSIAMENQAATCDIADLVDGRLFAVVFSHVMNPLDRNVINYPRLDTKLHELISILQLICGDRIKFGFPRTPSDVSVKVMPYAEVDQIKILPFSNAIFDKHLASIEISIDRSTIQNRQTARIFQEVSHWHNSKRKIDTKTLPPLTNWEKSRALRRNQFFMAEMQAYAASLTNAAGKILEPEIVTLADPKKASKILTESKQDSEESSGSKKVNKARGGSGRKGGGKKQMYESIAAKQAVKGNESAEKLFSSWQTVQKGLDSERSLSSKYIKTKAYLRNLADEKRAVLQPEVEFYLLTVLMDIYRILCGRKTENNVLRGEEFYGVAALIWDTILRLNPSHGLTTIMSENIKLISETLGLPLIELPAAVTDRPLSFKPNLSFLNIKDMSIPLDPIEFQCLHCGPYMDRNLDSAFDPRVPFRPDGWQRQVLDELDANRSVFVVAPTSAGKTFISFYAMEKILKADDDSVLVYVAPTKALVNQIAAEIQARYKKTYRYSKSVWAIHTRDYRINNPSGCQILVTVPHILQIMLLSPDNAKSWSKKVKTIIFDEIHSIGNAEDGVVWEQLLLLAPCPIIALSATVGNPEQFNSWLASTQKSAGFELKMIQHPYRYSDLRKFVYRPPERFAFYGLPEKASFAVLGLDGLEHFSFIHPIASLVNKSRGMPDDLSLEPRDCLTLWQAMVRHQNKDFPVNKSLSPGENVLSRIIRKVDIIKWEKSLKELLRAWMRNNQSPFDKVVEDLSMPLHDSSHPTIQVSSRHEVDSGSGEMVRIDADNLLDTTLPLLCKLHERDALPVILFNYDRNKCEQICSSIISQLTSSEARWKSKSPAWTKKLKDWEQWKLDQTKLAGKRIPKNIPKKKGKGDEDDVFSKADRIQEAASSEASPFASFDPHAPIDGFHFAVKHRAESSELDHHIWHLKRRGVAGWLIDALTRGIGVHHAGMNRKYRQV